MTHTALWVAAAMCALQVADDAIGAATAETKMERRAYLVAMVVWAFSLYGVMAALGWVS